MTYRFFVVDDDRHYARLLSYRLGKGDDHEVHVYHSGEDALAGIDEHPPDLVLLDVMMPGIGGIETLRRLQRFRPDLPVVMVSAQGTVDVAVEAMRAGARDYITKGQDDLVKLDAVVRQVKEKVSLAREVEALRGEVVQKYGLDEIVGSSKPMEEVYRLIRKALRGNLTVAIQGESGTGKELVARAIHFNSAPRPTADGKTAGGPGPFVVVNSAAIPSELMESEFFGHEKGSFTGAHARKIGKFEQADGGTLFLDEIGELDLGLQAKLLRALQSREITRVGGSDTVRFNCRVISATNRDIVQMVAEGQFREDLYYRLFQFPLPLPPLRERGQDVLVLAHHILGEFLEEYPDFAGKTLSRAARQAILAYTWPGNVRELKNAIERAVLISDGDQLTEADLMLDAMQAVAPWNERGQNGSAEHEPAPEIPGAFSASSASAARPLSETDVALSLADEDAADSADYALDDGMLTLEEMKRQAVERAFRTCEENVDRAAVELGIGRATMYRLLKKYGITAD